VLDCFHVPVPAAHNVWDFFIVALKIQPIDFWIKLQAFEQIVSVLDFLHELIDESSVPTFYELVLDPLGDDEDFKFDVLILFSKEQFLNSRVKRYLESFADPELWILKFVQNISHERFSLG
jgi:hypothetical protein